MVQVYCICFIFTEHTYSRSKSPQLLAAAFPVYPGPSSARPDSPIEPTPTTSDVPRTPVRRVGGGKISVDLVIHENIVPTAIKIIQKKI